MKPIRVTLEVRWEIPAPDYEAEFDGKTGVLVWATKTAWGELQVSVELDEPHSRFGKFCNIAYMNSSKRKNELFAVPVDEDGMERAYEFADIQNNNWGKFRSSNGSPLPWWRVDKMIEEVNHV